MVREENHDGTRFRLWVGCGIQERLFPGEAYPKDPFRTEFGKESEVVAFWNQNLGVNSKVQFDALL